MKDVKIVNVPRNVADKQIYMQSFCEAWIKTRNDYVEPGKWFRYKWFKDVLKAISLTGLSFDKRKAYLVCSRGGHLLKSSLPYNMRGEIIPMLWDCWPDTWDKLERDLKLLGCHTVFVTSSDVAREMNKRFPQYNFIHVPEGVNINEYKKGGPLTGRHIDVYELGRRHEQYHRKLVEGGLQDMCNFVYAEKPRKGTAIVFDTWDAFIDKLCDTKIIISFPASMTDAAKASIETLTIRYWESMLSRCVIVGHAPKELVDILGFNPVIEADMGDPAAQLKHILDNIAGYQEVVDRNYNAAKRIASWDLRMATILKVLKELGYGVVAKD